MLSGPKAGFDFVPFIDAILISLFVSLNISAFVHSPGTSIQLPDSPQLLATQANPAAVLTVDRNKLYFFEGLKLTRNNLESHLNNFIDERKFGPDNGEATLLIKADASIQTDELFQLMDIAQRAGFTQVHLAAEPSIRRSGADWEDEDESGQP